MDDEKRTTPYEPTTDNGSAPQEHLPDPGDLGPHLDDDIPDNMVLEKIDWADDPANPHNWSFAKRCFHTFVPTSIAFITTLSSSIYTPGRTQVMNEFGVSSTVAILPFSFYTLGLAFGPLIASPCSENFGRRAVYFCCTPIFAFFTLGAGFSQGIVALIVCRFFAGCFGSPAVSVGNGSISDVWAPHERAVPTALIVCGPFLGPAFGPLLGGFVVEGKDWRWTQWVILFFVVAFLTPAFFMSETYKKQILKNRSKKQKGNGSDLQRTETAASRASKAAQGIQVLLMNTLGRPIHMLFTEPIIGLFSLYVAFIFGVQYAFFESSAYVFETFYGFSIGSQGLTFLGLAAGCVIGFTTITTNSILFDRPRAARWRAQQEEQVALQNASNRTSATQVDAPVDPSALESGVVEAAHAKPVRTSFNPPPEFTLYIAYPGTIILPIALFLFGWTAQNRVHWIVPIIGEALFGTANLLIFMACTAYLMNTYGPRYGASAMAACSLLRYILGAVFPLFILQMYEKLGTGWATSLLGFVTVAMAVIPWCFMRWGTYLRSKSQYPCEG
ncbi:major facilitator superfamily domain-containing protein [Phyllosticta capitalensis]|uniref:Major facilitator superfamily domain-containing protein n=1 Tax=Phyllosticta capitalensis TaxID=121624 RepID=A0ABR1YS40_9PEZI